MSNDKEYPFYFEWKGTTETGEEAYCVSTTSKNISVSKTFDIAKEGIKIFAEDHSNVSCKVKNLYTGEEQIVS